VERVPVTATPVVAVCAAPRADGPAATEFLRVLAALRACGRAVALFEVGRGVGALSADAALSTEGSRYLDALEAEGVVPRADGDLAAALEAACGLVLLPDPDRAGRPALLRLRTGERPTTEALAAIAQAGQVALG
jgi:hypothetical protein